LDENPNLTSFEPSEIICMKAEILLQTNQRILASFCRKNHITRLSLFGSALRGEETAQSEIDQLVEFHPEHIPGLVTLAGMKIELSNLLEKKWISERLETLACIFGMTYWPNLSAAI
jgi:predicted nucleotidyltransferase